MTTEIDFKGIWFLPENENNEQEHITGNLTFSKDNGCDLALLGTLLDEFSDSNKNQDPEFILGLTSDGKRITLYKCFEYTRTISLPGIETSTYQPSYIFIGKHFRNNEELEFYGIKARFKNLDLWLGKFGFKKISYSNYNLVIDYQSPEPISFKINHILNGKINFNLSAPLNRNILKATIEQKAELEIESQIKKPFFEILNDLMYFQNFLTLGTFETAYPFSIKLFQEENEEENNEVVLVYKPSFVFSVDEKRHHREFLFTYLDLENNFEEIICKWFELKNKIEPVTSLLLDGFHNKGKFTENRFLNIVQALETYHRRFRKNEVRSKEEHKKMVDEIINSVDSSKKVWLQEKLNFSNEPTLHNRLLELLNSFSIETIDKIISDKEKFIKDTKNSRNYYTHYDESLEKKALKSNKLFTLTEKLKIILITIILIETGFSEEQIGKLFKRNEYRFFNHLIEK
jgi:hypothetical protein